MKINSEQMALLKKAIGSWNRENNCILALITDEFLKKDFDTLVELIAENKSDELLSLLIPYAGEETKSFWQDNKWIELSKTDDFIKSYRETPLKDDSVMWTVRAEGGETLFHTLKNDGFKLEILAKISDENKLFGVLNVPSYNASPILHSFNNPNSYFKLFERIKNQEHLEDLICRGRAAFYNTINLFMNHESLIFGFIELLDSPKGRLRGLQNSSCHGNALGRLSESGLAKLRAYAGKIKDDKVKQEFIHALDWEKEFRNRNEESRKQRESAEKLKVHEVTGNWLINNVMKTGKNGQRNS